MLIFNQQEEIERRRQLRNDQTPSEKILWERLRNKKLGIKFRRQFGVDYYVVDFYAPKIRLAIEIDGPIHRNRAEYDGLRQEEIQGLGITFLRFTAEEVTARTEAVIEAIRTKIPLLAKERD